MAHVRVSCAAHPPSGARRSLPFEIHARRRSRAIAFCAICTKNSRRDASHGQIGSVLIPKIASFWVLSRILVDIQQSPLVRFVQNASAEERNSARKDSITAAPRFVAHEDAANHGASKPRSRAVPCRCLRLINATSPPMPICLQRPRKPAGKRRRASYRMR